jgi:cytochrome P450
MQFMAALYPQISDPPAPDGPTGLRALQAMGRQRSPLAALELFHQTLGDVFKMRLFGFKATVLAGPEANRFVLVSHRHLFEWRMEHDPITRLLRRGLLVIDGAKHDALRAIMTPAFHKRMLTGYTAAILRHTDAVSANWMSGQTVDMLDQIRQMAVLILMETMFGVDFSPEMAGLYPAVLRSLRYVGPGPWLLWPGLPRPGYGRALGRLDDTLLGLIRSRRQSGQTGDDLLGLLLAAGLDDDLIRDQLFTMLIAGHDTGTALLAWVMFLLGRHPNVLARARAEVDRELAGQPPTTDSVNRLTYLEQVINETLRLYPPLHLGLRRPVEDIEFASFHLPAGERVMYSPFLTHRHPCYWPNPHQFDPDRFAPEQIRRQAPFAFVPFGGGPRICLGAALAQLEAKVMLARLLQRFNFTLVQPQVHMHMGVTVEPHPGVLMQAARR